MCSWTSYICRPLCYAYLLSYLLHGFAYSCYIVAMPLGHRKQTGSRNTTDRPKKFCQTELNTCKWIDLSKMGELERRKQCDSRRSGKKLNIQTNEAASLHVSFRFVLRCCYKGQLASKNVRIGTYTVTK